MGVGRADDVAICAVHRELGPICSQAGVVGTLRNGWPASRENMASSGLDLSAGV